MKKVQVVLVSGKDYTFNSKEVEGLSEMGFRFRRSNGTMYFFPMSAILMVKEYGVDESEDKK